MLRFGRDSGTVSTHAYRSWISSSEKPPAIAPAVAAYRGPAGRCPATQRRAARAPARPALVPAALHAFNLKHSFKKNETPRRSPRTLKAASKMPRLGLVVVAGVLSWACPTRAFSPGIMREARRGGAVPALVLHFGTAGRLGQSRPKRPPQANSLLTSCIPRPSSRGLRSPSPRPRRAVSPSLRAPAAPGRRPGLSPGPGRAPSSHAHGRPVLRAHRRAARAGVVRECAHLRTTICARERMRCECAAMDLRGMRLRKHARAKAHANVGTRGDAPS